MISTNIENKGIPINKANTVYLDIHPGIYNLLSVNVVITNQQDDHPKKPNKTIILKTACLRKSLSIISNCYTIILKHKPQNVGSL